MIKYLGSKRTLLPQITKAIQGLPIAQVIDPFSGTARVGHHFKREGYNVISGDNLRAPHQLAVALVQADKAVHERAATQLIQEFNALPGEPGFFTKTYCEDARFFHPKNGARVDTIRNAIEAKSLPPELHAVMLTSLMLAADRVDSTVGLQMAYLKQWAKRAHKDLQLELPPLLNSRRGKCDAYCMDALDLLQSFEGCCDLVYLDPPYNQHSYAGNYHIWETLVRWDSPEVYGVANKRVDTQTNKSAFNSKKSAADAFTKVIEASAAAAPYVLVSFNKEGFLSPEFITQTLEVYGKVTTTQIPYGRHIGRKIGIHNLKGEPVGTEGAAYTEEYLFLLRVTYLDSLV